MMLTFFKLFNRVLAFVKYLIFSLAILFVVVLAGVNLPFVQRFITSKVNNAFIQKNIPLHVEKVTLLIDGRVGITKPELIINKSDTVIYAGMIKVSVKMLPLVFKKIKVDNISIIDAVVNLSIDSTTGNLNLVRAFSGEENTKKPDSTPGKIPDIGINNVSLKNIRFTFNDKKNGTSVFQYVENLKIGIDRFSLQEKEIFADYIDLENAIGGVELLQSAPETDTLKITPADWKFKLRRGNLKDIKFTLLQPQNKQQIDFYMGKSNISEAGFELAGKRISAISLSLEEPGVEVFSSPSETGKNEVVSEAGINPQTPQGGLYNPLSFNKSPLGDLGVYLNKVASETASSFFPGPWIISGKNVKFNNGFYNSGSFADTSASLTEKPILQIAGLSAEMTDINLSSSESGFTMNGITLVLDNGLRLDNGEISFHSDSTRYTTLQSSLVTELSSIHFRIEAEDDLAAILRSWKNVPFSLNVDKTEVSLVDILAFLPTHNEKSTPWRESKLKLVLNCNITGTSDSLCIRDLNFRTPAGNSLSFNGQIKDILNPDSARINIGFQTSPITASRIEEILLFKGSPSDLPDFEPTSLKGKLEGNLTSQDFLISLGGMSGNIEATGSFSLKDKRYKLQMDYSGLEAGKLTGMKDLGRISGRLNISGREYSPEKIELKASVKVDSANYRGYLYHGINAEVSGDNGMFDYSLRSVDPSLLLDLKGTAALQKTLTDATLSGSFDADAGKLNIYRGITARGFLDAALRRSGSEIEASGSIKDLVVSNGSQTEKLDSLAIRFHSGDSLVTGSLKTDFAKADLRLSGSLDDIAGIFSGNRIKGFYLVDSTVSNRIPFVSVLPALNFSLETTYDPLLGLFISDSGLSYNRIKVFITKDPEGTARADMTVDRIKLGTSSSYSIVMNFNSHSDSSVFQLKSDSIRFRGISLAGLRAEIEADGDTLLYRLKAVSKKDTMLYSISGAAFKDDQSIKMITNQPEWVINGNHWTVNPGVFLVIDPSGKDLTADLHWKNGDHTIDFYGRKSEKLFLGLEKVWLSMLAIPGMNIFGYEAELTGLIDYQGKNGNELNVRMDLNQMKLSGNILGDLSIDGNYTSDTLGNTSGEIRSILNDTSGLDITIRSDRKTKQNSISSELRDIPLNLLESFTTKYVSGLKGEVSGNLKIASVSEKPRLDGEIIIRNTELKVVPLNAMFFLDDDNILIENSNLIFEQFRVLDSLNKELSLNGKIDFSQPGNVTADLKITSDHLQVMNTSASKNPAFNGSVFVDSRLTVTGPVQKPAISGSIVLAEGTNVKYKLTENLNVSETEKTVTFASLNEDAGSEKPKVNLISRFPNIEASIEVNPNSLFSFEISRGYDIGISITGGGFLNYASLPNGTISLSGTYGINQGKSELKIPGWPRKDFIITTGSSVKWNGAADDPELNIETTSKVRGSYYNPVDSKNREVNFIVNMKIFNRLSQLEILFDVSSNDQYLTSVFNTLSADERMKQAINLLIFERVELPNMASSSDYVTQQINQFWESQLNQLTKSAIKGVDLSFGIDTYTGAKEGGGEQTYTSLTYEVKKEMFNERGTVMVSGRMNDNSQAGAPTNNMLENFIFEYALDSARSKYLKVYRQQNYEDLLEGEVIKSGIGYIYRKNYNRLGDIWRRQNKKDSKELNTGDEQ